jgi:DNA-binding transcriptional MerR regulator
MRLRRPPSRYTITQAGRLTDLTARAMRIYEERGLIRPARSGDNAVRYYSDEDIATLVWIGKARRAGLTIHEIGNLLDVGRRLGLNAQLAKLTEVCRVKAAALEAQRRELERLAQEALSLTPAPLGQLSEAG